MAFKRSGTLAVGDKDGSTYLWDAATRDQKATLIDPASGTLGIGPVAFQPRRQDAGDEGTPMARPTYGRSAETGIRQRLALLVKGGEFR